MMSSDKAVAQLFVEEIYDEEIVSINEKFTDGVCVLVLKDEFLNIGRSDSNTITIDHPAVSSSHCCIWSVQFDEDSIPLIYIKDISLNGTFINGERLVKNQVYLLSNYDIVSIDFGISFKYMSVYGDNESSIGDCLIEDNNITVDFPNWLVKNRVLGNGTFGYVTLYL